MHLTGDLMVDSEKFRKLLLCLAIVLSASVTGFGCWCRDPGPVLDRFENSKSVVVARVASVGETEATLVVDRVYKGKLRSGVALRFRQGVFTDCVRGFESEEIGGRYLLYLGKPPKDSFYEASTCNGSNKLASAFDDLAYLDRMAEVAGKTRLSGYFTTASSDNPDVEGLLVRITGKRNSYTLTTDKNGFFEVYGLAPGDYIIEPQIPEHWKIDRKYMFGDEDNSANFKGFTGTIKSMRHTLARIRIRYDISALPAARFAPADAANAAKHPRDHNDRDLKTDLLKVILGGDTL